MKFAKSKKQTIKYRSKFIPMAIEELLDEFANDLTKSELKWIYLLDNFYYENNYLSEKQFNILLNVFSKFETDESAINELITESKFIS